jgi:hypothetical protein
MVSRTVGPFIGATIGLVYFLGNIVMGVMECLGMIEIYFVLKPEHKFNDWAVQIGGFGCLIVLCFMISVGSKLIARLGVLFIFALFATMLCYFVGFFTVA